jgi:cytochrome c oxidase assembly protein subunit 15
LTRPLAAGFAALAAATWVLIVLGALVRANGAGLACPDWPLCFGSFVPRFDARVALEWGHRVLAGSVSVGLAVLSAAAWRTHGMRPRLIVLWVLLALQVVLGGLTVLLGLAPWTVTLHLLIGNAFCAALLWTALDLRERERPVARPALPARVRAGATLALILVAGQIALGGLVSSHAAGLACASFPTCDGQSLAPTLHGLVGVHVLHRLNGFLLLGLLAWLIWTARDEPHVGRLARGMTRLVLVQIVIGVMNVLLRLPVELTALHSAVAAAIVLLAALLARELVRSRSASVASATTRALEAR